MLPSTASEISGCREPSSPPWLATSLAASASASLRERTAATCSRNFPDGSREATVFSARDAFSEVDTCVTNADPMSGPGAAVATWVVWPQPVVCCAGATAGCGGGGVIEEVDTVPSLALGVLDEPPPNILPMLLKKPPMPPDDVDGAGGPFVVEFAASAEPGAWAGLELDVDAAGAGALGAPGAGATGDPFIAVCQPLVLGGSAANVGVGRLRHVADAGVLIGGDAVLQCRLALGPRQTVLEPDRAGQIGDREPRLAELAVSKTPIIESARDLLAAEAAVQRHIERFHGLVGFAGLVELDAGLERALRQNRYLLLVVLAAFLLGGLVCGFGGCPRLFLGTSRLRWAVKRSKRQRTRCEYCERRQNASDVPHKSPTRLPLRHGPPALCRPNVC